MMHGIEGMKKVTRYEPTTEWLAELNQRIDKGVEWLIEKKGKTWDRGIDLSTLKMHSSCLCVVGQCFRDQAQNTNTNGGFFYVIDLMHESYDSMREKGFNFSDRWDFRDDDYELEKAQWSLLGDLWKGRILAKRRREKRNLMRG